MLFRSPTLGTPRLAVSKGRRHQDRCPSFETHRYAMRLGMRACPNIDRPARRAYPSRMFDLVIRNGTVIDGSGTPRRVADVAVQNGRIAAVGSRLGTGKREIDASGLLVTPGFVDIHTHYDGQATWDSRLQPSSWHGVTTAVMGNCGVGFAPVKFEDRQRLIELMEGVEDIPGAALDEDAVAVLGQVMLHVHLLRLRALQDETGGFTAFIAWSYQPQHTELAGQEATGIDYLRTLAIARIVLVRKPRTLRRQHRDGA